MNVINKISSQQETIVRLCKQYKVKKLEIFGSAITDSFNNDSSDIDFLVEFLSMQPVQHAQCYFSLLADLQDLFQRDIDLVEIPALRNPYFIKNIQSTRNILYAA
jgi:predicted nucleotidyltransferase